MPSNTGASGRGSSASTPDPPPFEPFVIAQSEPIYDSYWCRLRRDQLRLEDGGLQEYHVFEVAPAVCIVPVLPDGSILMLWQFRHPHGGTHWEVPAGRIDEGESPEQSAQRELLEETGHRARSLERVAGFHPIHGISPHYAHIFLGHDCERVAEPTPDPAERMTLGVLSALEARERLMRGDFVDGFTQLALFHHFARSAAE